MKTFTIIDPVYKKEGLRFYKETCPTLNARDYKEPKIVMIHEKSNGGGVLIAAISRTDEAKAIRKESMKNGKDYTPFQGKKIDFKESETMNTITCATQKDNLIIQLNSSTESGGVQPFQQNMVYDTDGILPALPAQMSNGTHAIQVKSATKDGFEIATEGDSINLSNPNSKTRRGRVGVGVAQTLDTQSNQSVLLEGNIRRLTEIECERLQGFPDNWTQYGIYEKEIWINKKEKTFEIVFEKHKVPRTQRYKLCGNAVNVKTAKLVTDKLFDLF